MSEPTATETAEAVPGGATAFRRAVATGRWRTAVAWTAVGCWGVWALVRLTGADRLPGVRMPVVPLLSFTPYAAATAVLPVACAVLLRRRRALVASLLVGVLLAAPLLPRALGGDRTAAHGPAVRVMTANLLFGLADAGHLRDLVHRHAVDVLSVQELTPDGAARLQAAGLTRLLPHRVLHLEDGAAGTGLYSRHPLRELPPIPDTVMAMPRAEFTLPGGYRVEVTAVHPPPPISRPAVRAWRHDLRELPPAAGSGRDGRPVRILAGDFNATLDHAHLRQVLSRGYADAADRAGRGLVPTWRPIGTGLPLTIDHVLVDRRCAVREVKVHDLPGSDHRTVFADIRLP